MEPVGRILLAEDEPGIAEPVIEELSLRGHNVKWVRAVRELRTELPEYRPDVLLLDVTLETDGLELFQAIRFSPECPPGGVVVLTAPGDIPMRERAAQLGAAAVISKPLSTDHLASIVEDLLTLI